MSERPYPRVTVSKKCEKFLCDGHVWVYDNEIKDAENCADGAVADVFGEKGKYLGSGFYNGHSKIRVRVLTKNANDRVDDGKFFARRVKYAVDYRKTVMPGDDFKCCRLIFGEADGFPGLTVDRYGDVLSAQCLCLGTERRKKEIYDALIAYLRACGEKITALYERSDAPIRALEGMAPYAGFYEGDGLRTDLDGKTEICENGIVYGLDFINGQKTGFFLDQKYNRLALRRIAKDRTVLDCCTHTGSFALNAAKGGAKRVTAVDISADAIGCARRNAERNGIENIDFAVADVFEFLDGLKKSGQSPYDLIVLDPPAFTKSTATVKNAYGGYRRINEQAMRLLPRGGYLATCSCSHFMTPPLFEAMLDEAAKNAGVSLRQIEARRQAPDHPILRGVPETEYLKFYLLQVI